MLTNILTKSSVAIVCRSVYVLLFLLIACVAQAAPGGRPAIQDKDLVRIFAAIKAADGYVYTLSVSSRILPGTAGGSADSVVRASGLQYASRADAVAYNTNGAEQFVFCGKGLFKLNIPQKAIHYHLFTNSGELTGFLSSYPADGGAAVLDSLLLQPASIVSKKKIGQLTTYRLTYPKDWIIREATLSYDAATGFVKQMSYTMDRVAGELPGPLAKPGESRTVVRQQVTMSNYSKTLPPNALELLTGIQQEGVAYLQRRYAGYRIQAF